MLSLHATLAGTCDDKCTGLSRMRMHQVRRWNAEMCTCTERNDGATAVYSVAAAPAGSQLVAFGGAERALHIWDPRTPAGKETVR